MAKFGFCGGSYASASLSADAQRTINLIPEKVESGAGKSDLALYLRPGKKLFCLLPDAPGRNLLTINGRSFAVNGSSLFELLQNGGKTLLGAVANDGQPASMAASDTQLLVASGGTLYVVTLATNAFQVIPAATITGVTQVGYSDGFFTALIPGSKTWQASSPLDAKNWPGTQFTGVSVFPDDLVGMLCDHREVWIWGRTKAVVYYDSGNQPFPFDVVPGGFIEQGLAAAFSPFKLDNSVFWIGGDERGSGMAWRANGYQPARVSTHAIETEWQNYPAGVTDAEGYSYQEDGHSFAVWRFPSASKTWAYDVSTGLWHERAYLEANGKYTADRARFHTYNDAWKKHLVCDWNSGAIYESANAVPLAAGWDFVSDFGNPIKWLRRAPYITSPTDFIFFSQLRIDLEMGLGPIPPLVDGAGNARDPQIMLRWSDNGSKTWSNEHWRDCGQAGEFRKRARWTRLGRADGTIGRIFEASGSDPIPWRIIDADVKANPGYGETERLASQLRKGA